MSTDKEEVAEDKNNSTPNPEAGDLMSQILAERKEKYKNPPEYKKIDEKSGEETKKEDPKNESAKNPKDQKEDQKKASEKKESSSPDRNQDKASNPKEVGDDDDDDDEDEVPEHVAVLEKTKKRLTDAQSWGSSVNRKLKAGLKKIEGLYESGDIPENLFNDLIETLKSDHPEPKEEKPGRDENPINYLVDIAFGKIPELKEVMGDDEEFDEKIYAFDLFTDLATEEDRRELLGEIEDLEGSPLKLAKKLYSIGEKNYPFYQEVKEAGGIKKLIEAKDKKIESKDKTIDKLKKRLSQYEDHDKPTNRIEELGLEMKDPSPRLEDGNLIGQILSERKVAMSGSRR